MRWRSVYVPCSLFIPIHKRYPTHPHRKRVRKKDTPTPRLHLPGTQYSSPYSSRVCETIPKAALRNQPRRYENTTTFSSIQYHHTQRCTRHKTLGSSCMCLRGYSGYRYIHVHSLTKTKTIQHLRLIRLYILFRILFRLRSLFIFRIFAIYVDAVLYLYLRTSTLCFVGNLLGLAGELLALLRIRSLLSRCRSVLLLRQVIACLFGQITLSSRLWTLRRVLARLGAPVLACPFPQRIGGTLCTPVPTTRSLVPRSSELSLSRRPLSSSTTLGASLYRGHDPIPQCRFGFCSRFCHIG